MFTPLNNLGANLMLVFAWGSVWSTGYLVSPFLQGKLDYPDILFLQQLVVAFALFCFAINLLARLKTFQWQFNLKDVPLQMNLGALVIGGLFLFLASGSENSAKLLFGFLSIAGVAWVAYLKIE